MKSPFRGRSMVCLALACTFMASAPVVHADSSARIARRADKIHKKLTKYKPGTYLEFKFRDRTDTSGNLGALDANTFTFTNSESNAKETHPYADVSKVEKGKTYIGEGTAPRHHIHLF